MLLPRPPENGCTIWLTGPTLARGALARAVGRRLREAGRRVEVIDGAELRARDVRARRRVDHAAHVAWVSRALARNGVFVVAAPAAPAAPPADRARVLAVHVATPGDAASAEAPLTVSPAMGEDACVDAVIDALRAGGHLPADRPDRPTTPTEPTDR